MITVAPSQELMFFLSALLFSDEFIFKFLLRVFTWLQLFSIPPLLVTWWFGYVATNTKLVLYQNSHSFVIFKR